jgi:hypothetical protein
VDRAVRSLVTAGVTRILVVAREDIAEQLPHLTTDPGVPLSFAVARRAASETSILEAARNELGPGPVLIHPGDSLLPSGFGDLDGGECVFTYDGRAIAWSLPDLPASLGDPVTTRGEVESVELDAGWRYDGTVDGVLEANHMALDALKRGRVGADLSRATVQGRVQIHPTAVLDGAKLRGPVHVGPGAVISETYVGPYTSVGAGVRLEGVEIEHSIVLDHAVISFPGRRLEASLVGEGAQIGRDFNLPSALRLRVGRGSDIQLS